MTLLILEDGTGRPDANAYDLVEDAVTWLTAQGLTALAQEPEDERPQHLLAGTRKAEQLARGRVEGEPINKEQGLLFPRGWCYTCSGELLARDERPLGYRQGIFLLTEASAAGRLEAEPTRNRIAGAAIAGMRINYREVQPFEERHADALALISNVMNLASWGTV